MKLSANLGFLWTDRDLPKAIIAAHNAGFDAVECHFPFDVPTTDIIAALHQTGLPMLGLNTRPEMRGIEGGRGLAALPERQGDAKELIKEAINYAAIIGAQNVHVMAGVTEGEAASKAYLNNLQYACDYSSEFGIDILIEPFNANDVPGYFLSTTKQAIDVIEAVRATNLKLMFDCYHVELIEGQVEERLEACLPWIGHIQIAAVPDRGAPDHGTVDFESLFRTIDRLYYQGHIGAEYLSDRPTDETLDWLKSARAV